MTDKELTDPTKTKEFDPDEKLTEIAGKKKKRVVKINLVMMKAELPEQGSWHYNRRREILAKHPEVEKLYGQNPWSFFIMLAGLALHSYIAIQVYKMNWYWFMLMTYTVGVYLQWFVGVLGHEGSHGLVFKSKALNRLHTIIALLPLFLGPFGIYWSVEHMYHHQVVVDKMSRYGPQNAGIVGKVLRSLLVVNVLNIAFAIITTIVFIRIMFHGLLYFLGMRKTPFPESYKLRPFDSFPQVANSKWFILNYILSFSYHAALCYFGGFSAIMYTYLSNGFCQGLHPLGMRQVQEHYMQKRSQPTNSVYSPLNFFLLNIGFHNEHHDFPSIPWNRLSMLRKIAPEYYNNLFYFNSYMEIFWIFLTTPGVHYKSLIEDSLETEVPQK